MLYQQNITSALIASIYQAKGDFAQAHQWLLQHNTINNDIFSPKITRALVKMEDNHEFEENFKVQALAREKEDLI